MCNVNSPAKYLQIELLANFITSGKTVKGTLISRIVDLGLSPINLLFNVPCFNNDHFSPPDGIIDSLRYLVTHEDFSP